MRSCDQSNCTLSVCGSSVMEWTGIVIIINNYNVIFTIITKMIIIIITPPPLETDIAGER